jgi:Stress responsive A/B Barrel Domain
MIRHCVLFSFIEGTDEAGIDRIERDFNLLKTVIPEIADMEWGLNNSPEGKTKGFTHMFLLTFNNVYDRDSYLIDPNHQAFSSLVGPFLKDVLVFDYET